MDESPPQSSSTVELAPGVRIAAGELHFHFARSGGPGGQNVNKVNSKAELRLKPEALQGLSGAALYRLKTAHGGKITGDGDLLLVADADRSQYANRMACLEKLRAIVLASQKEPKVRRKTRPTAGSRERRIESKKAHSKTKAGRRWSE